MQKCLGICILFLMFVSITIQKGFAEDHIDDLLLAGFVKSFDANRGIIRIQVTNEGCEGLREFRVPDDVKEDLDTSLIGERLLFYINSSTCERGKIYDMRLER